MTASYQYAKRLSEIPRYERDGKTFIDDTQLMNVIEELFHYWNYKQVFHSYDESKDVMYWTFMDGSCLTISNGYQHKGKPATYQARG